MSCTDNCGWQQDVQQDVSMMLNSLYRPSSSLPKDALTAAILYTAGSITIPSLASVYSEMALKRGMHTSVHIQNFFLYFFGLLFNLIGLASLLVLGHQSASELFKGHSQVGQQPCPLSVHAKQPFGRQ